MYNFLLLIKTVVQLLPVLITVIATLEQVLPHGGQGAVKLDALKAIMQTAYEAANEAQIPFEKVWGVLDTATTKIVAIFKITEGNSLVQM